MKVHFIRFFLHNNPLRAGMVKRLIDYRWSSYPAYAYIRRHPKWLDIDLIFRIKNCAMISQSDKLNRDILLYWLWQDGK
ncbi:hypothetical protein D1AOALGA4SA_12948 [Olavius algarvensis Delta 1 endosymbiont]|nr:hypothetical protein D1AOALGA4SA_12948 [Olavius algarvensis Delta 1 endosymbiont]